MLHWYYRKCTIGYQKWAQMNYLHAIITAELHVHEVRASVAPYLRKCGNLAIREILIKHDCTPIHSSTQQVNVYQWKLTQPTGLAPKCNMRLFGQKIASPPPSCEAETTKESIKQKRKAEIVSVSLLSKVLSID